MSFETVISVTLHWYAKNQRNRRSAVLKPQIDDWGEGGGQKKGENLFRGRPAAGDIWRRKKPRTELLWFLTSPLHTTKVTKVLLCFCPKNHKLTTKVVLGYPNLKK